MKRYELVFTCDGWRAGDVDSVFDKPCKKVATTRSEDRSFTSYSGDEPLPEGWMEVAGIYFCETCAKRKVHKQSAKLPGGPG